ncbi:MAG: hypothetical protein IJA02_10065 [Clostridia bacterium]|nr:hypothetical protein [Clostridia bacterium]
MRSFSLIAVLLLVLSIAFAGCSDSQSISGGQEETSLQQVSGQESKGDTSSVRVIGKIKSVAGNQITLELAEMPEEMSRPEMPNGDFEGFSRPEGMTMAEGMEFPEGMEMPEGMTPPEGFEGKMPEGDFSMPDGDFSMPDFANGERPQGGGRMPGMNMEDIELEYTGETAKYTIPVGVKVGSGDYTSLSKGMVIMLSLDDNNAVSSVMIISQ